MHVENDETLWVSPGGNIVRALHGETPFSQVRAFKPPASPQPASALVGVLKIERPKAGLKYVTVSQTPARRDAVVSAIEVQSAPEVWLPAWLFQPSPGQPRRTLLILDPAGRNQRWHEDELLAELAAQGNRVCAADVRGIGDLTPEYGRGSPRYEASHQREDAYTWASLILGHPLLGQRVSDILAFVEALGPLTVVARGKMTPPALIAAALDTRVQQLQLIEPNPSFRSIIESETYSAPFANFAYGLLKYTDLPDIEASLGGRVKHSTYQRLLERG